MTLTKISNRKSSLCIPLQLHNELLYLPHPSSIAAGCHHNTPNCFRPCSFASQTFACFALETDYHSNTILSMVLENTNCSNHQTVIYTFLLFYYIFSYKLQNHLSFDVFIVTDFFLFVTKNIDLYSVFS